MTGWEIILLIDVNVSRHYSGHSTSIRFMYVHWSVQIKPLWGNKLGAPAIGRVSLAGKTSLENSRIKFAFRKLHENQVIFMTTIVSWWWDSWRFMIHRPVIYSGLFGRLSNQNTLPLTTTISTSPVSDWPNTTLTKPISCRSRCHEIAQPPHQDKLLPNPALSSVIRWALSQKGWGSLSINTSCVTPPTVETENAIQALDITVEIFLIWKLSCYITVVCSHVYNYAATLAVWFMTLANLHVRMPLLLFWSFDA